MPRSLSIPIPLSLSLTHTQTPTLSRPLRYDIRGEGGVRLEAKMVRDRPCCGCLFEWCPNQCPLCPHMEAVDFRTANGKSLDGSPMALTDEQIRDDPYFFTADFSTKAYGRACPCMEACMGVPLIMIEKGGEQQAQVQREGLLKWLSFPFLTCSGKDPVSCKGEEEEAKEEEKERE
jgi:hypothetical protein